MNEEGKRSTMLRIRHEVEGGDTRSVSLARLSAALKRDIAELTRLDYPADVLEELTTARNSIELLSAILIEAHQDVLALEDEEDYELAVGTILRLTGEL